MPSPNQNLIATVVANGQKYRTWESIEIERRYETNIMHMRLQCAEMVDIRGSSGFSALRLKPWDKAQGYLGDQLAITGEVCLRQAHYDKGAHIVTIVVAGQTQALLTSTVDGVPGYYQKYNFSQISNAIANKVGVKVIVQGNPASASKPFPRFSEHIGESRLAAISRAAAMRNLYLVPDKDGNLLATQGTGGNVATLVEGKNIETATLTLRNNEWTNPINSLGQNFSGSLTSADDELNRKSKATVEATSSALPTTMPNRPETVAMPEPGDSQDAAWYAARVAAYALATWIEGQIIVPGWFLDSGDLWINHVGNLVTINSPMLVPTDTITLAIKGVTHRQNNSDGTQTVIEVCDPASLGTQGAINSTGVTGNQGLPGFSDPVAGP